MARKPKGLAEGSERTIKRIGLELSEEISVEVDAYLDAHKLIHRPGAWAILRETAREAAENAIKGNVGTILQRHA